MQREKIKRGDLVKVPAKGLFGIVQHVRESMENYMLDVFMGDGRIESLSPFDVTLVRTGSFLTDEPHNFLKLMEAYKVSAEMTSETLDDVCKALDYQSEQNPRDGDVLVRIANTIFAEHAAMKERLEELEEVITLDGKLCWRASGEPLQARLDGSQTSS